jgi:small subunit ribosomal protein S17
MPKRILRGVVVSDKCETTLIVKVERRFMHPIYKKTVRKSKKYAVHDGDKRFKEGDQVSIIESKPISKTKKWQVIYN